MYTAFELWIINFAIQFQWKNPRQYALAWLVVASSILSKIKTSVQDDKFIDWDIDFTSEEKVFLKWLIESEQWTANDGEAVINLLQKLK